MTNILFKLKNNNIVYFEIKGHANFGSFGNDIVCSAVSSTVLMTINGLIEIANLVDVKYTIEEGYIFCDLLSLREKDFQKSNILTKSLLSILSDISKKYSKNIKLNIREV